MICLKAIALTSLLISFFVPNAFAVPEQNWHNVYSWYRPVKGDGLKTIKRRLLYKNFDRAIKRELKKKGKSSDLFFQMRDEKFNESIKEEEENFKLRIGLVERTAELDEEGRKIVKVRKGLSPKTIADLNRRVRNFRFNKLSRFQNIYRSIVSYKVLRQWRDEKERTIQRMQAKVQVDVPSLVVSYANIIEKKPKMIEEGQQEETLYVRLNYEMDGFTWVDLNFTSEDEFHSSLTEAWIKWIKADFKRKNRDMNILKYRTLLGEKMKPKDALLDMHVRIKKDILEKTFRRYLFRLAVDFSVLSSDYQLLYEGKLRKQNKEITQVEPDRVPNLLANALYKVPLVDFIHIKKSLDQKSERSQKDQVIVKSFKNLKQVHEFIDSLNSYGAEIKLRAEISSITSKEITLNLFYRGEQEKLIKIVEFLGKNGFPHTIQSREFPLTLTF